MVFRGADAPLRGKGTVVVWGDVFIRNEGNFENENEIGRSFVVEKEVSEGGGKEL